ncbi:DJ-1 family glyoxalase III [Aerococcaceae bacterium WGS1372]
MKKIAVILAEGFEEIEAIAPIDILRRANFQVDTYGLSEFVTGSHNITVKSDYVLEETLTDYDVILLPGGLPGAENLRDNPIVIESIQNVNASSQFVAAICAAPIVLEEANLLKNIKFTHFPGLEDQLQQGDHQKDATVVVDGHIITARGAGVALEFAYTIVDILGGNSQELRESMQYDYLFKNN